MKPSLHQLRLPGPMLARGFWLYVWEITTVRSDKWLYIGRTGDSSSCNAQSPFVRMGQHLGKRPESNALRRHLVGKGVDADSCTVFDLRAYGPIRREESDEEPHRRSRDVVAALEKGLRDALCDAGYEVLNEVPCRKQVDTALLREVIAAFAEHFPLLHAKG